MALRIAPDGTKEVMRPYNGVAFTLEEMKAAIGCQWVAAVRLRDGRIMWLDEEGLLQDPPKPTNFHASVLYWQARGGITRNLIVGTVLVTTLTEAGED